MSAPGTMSGNADRVGVEAVVDEALGDVAGLDTPCLLLLIAEDDLVHRWRLVRQFVVAFELFADVVGVEHGVFGGLAQAVRAVREDVGEGADEHAEVAVEHAYAADRVRAVVVEAERAVGIFADDRAWAEKARGSSCTRPGRSRGRRRRAVWRRSCAG